MRAKLKRRLAVVAIAGLVLLLGALLLLRPRHTSTVTIPLYVKFPDGHVSRVEGQVPVTERSLWKRVRAWCGF